MANLIITIISIALVAIAALMGAYYGGQAFMSASAKAKANTYVSAAQQIAAAWQVYTVAHGGNPIFPSNGTQIDDSNALVTEGYLASAPQISVGGAPVYFRCWVGLRPCTGSQAESNFSAGIPVVLRLSLTENPPSPGIAYTDTSNVNMSNMPVCAAILQIANAVGQRNASSVSATQPSTTSETGGDDNGWPNPYDLTKRKFDCIIGHLASIGPTYINETFFSYRVF